VSLISDKLILDNSIGISLTQTWLEENICDAELQIENHDLFRADRVVCNRGGTAIYLITELNSKMITSFSNSVVEVCIVKSKILDTIFVSVYRPPNTQTNEWKEAVEVITKSIELAQSHGDYGTIIMSGDFNFQSLEWDNNQPKIDINLNLQQELLVIMMNDLFLLNVFDIPMHKDNNILDLIQVFIQEK